MIDPLPDEEEWIDAVGNGQAVATEVIVTAVPMGTSVHRGSWRLPITFASEYRVSIVRENSSEYFSYLLWLVAVPAAPDNKCFFHLSLSVI